MAPYRTFSSIAWIVERVRGLPNDISAMVVQAVTYGNWLVLALAVIAVAYALRTRLLTTNPPNLVSSLYSVLSHQFSAINEMRHLDPAVISPAESHRYLLGGVAPRPIAFVGTLDAEGRPNLSPFSFFNAFGANPPVIAFSPAYRGTDGTPKHTFLNIKATGEFTVSVVSYAMVEQASLASSEYAEGVDEFIKAGFTKLPSHRIAPPGVAESPMVMECRLLQHIDLGGKPASGNLMIGEVVMFHIHESAFNGNYLDAERLDLVGRMGGALYCRASGPAVFTLAKPTHAGIGFDALPEHILRSTVLTGNDLAKLAGAEHLPDAGAIRAAWNELMSQAPEAAPDDLEIELRTGNADRALQLLAARMRDGASAEELEHDLHRTAQVFLRSNRLDGAWQAVMAGEGQ